MTKQLPTIAMTPMPEFGYDPIPLILSGEKKHTLRKQKMHGRKEITVGRKRTGIVIEFYGWTKMHDYDWAHDDVFAEADGFCRTSADKTMPMVSGKPWSTWSPARNLRRLLEHFYDEVPETMWCNYFRVVQRPEGTN